MNFEEAIGALTDGRFVRRRGWSKDFFIAMPWSPTAERKVVHGPIYVLQGTTAPFMARWKARGVEDYLANDWEVVGFEVREGSFRDSILVPFVKK